MFATTMHTHTHAHIEWENSWVEAELHMHFYLIWLLIFLRRSTHFISHWKIVADLWTISVWRELWVALQ